MSNSIIRRRPVIGDVVIDRKNDVAFVVDFIDEYKLEGLPRNRTKGMFYESRYMMSWDYAEEHGKFENNDSIGSAADFDGANDVLDPSEPALTTWWRMETNRPFCSSPIEVDNRTQKYARVIFENDPGVLAHIAKYDGTVDKAYARAIFGYMPERQWGEAAWSLAGRLSEISLKE